MNALWYVRAKYHVALLIVCFGFCEVATIIIDSGVDIVVSIGLVHQRIYPAALFALVRPDGTAERAGFLLVRLAKETPGVAHHTIHRGRSRSARAVSHSYVQGTGQGDPTHL